MLFRSRQNKHRNLWDTPNILETFWEVKISTPARPNTASGILQLWLNYLAASLFKKLTYTFPWRLRGNTPVVF